MPEQRLPKLMELIPEERKKEEGTTKENLDGGCARGYDCQRVRGGSMDGQRGMAFGFRKATEDVMISQI